MKRSTHIRLTLMTAALPLALAGCSKDAPTGAIAQSIDECVKAKAGTYEECSAAYGQALAKHDATAPKFEDKSDCDAQFGNCTAHTDERGHSSFMPPMSGFLIGYLASSAMNGQRAPDCRTAPSANGCRGSGGSGFYGRYAGGSPVYRDRNSGDFLKADGESAGRRSGFVSGEAGRAASSVRGATVARGGFGGTGSAHASFGS
ncbi:MAG: DUF1190 domain-containing protein [Proteobacteria bacterium]|nr:DUF1190 domain-containing protein [Pseudomonadota bacterium]